MLRKLIALTALAAVGLVVAPAPAEADDPYMPLIPTTTIVNVIENTAGNPVVLETSASANSPTQPTGNIAITISAAGGTAARGARVAAMAPVFTTTVHFAGTPVRVKGPNLPEGSYVANATFTPDNPNLFISSGDTTLTFRMVPAKESGEVGGKSSGAAAGGGGLPNTGGPHLLWLALGGILVAVGAGGVNYGRRRTPSAA